MNGTNEYVIRLADVTPIDGYCGQVYELVDLNTRGAKAISVALVEINVGQVSQAHWHRFTEEIYFVIGGEGEVQLGDASGSVGMMDSVVIPTGTKHSVKNTGSGVLRILTINSPPYDPADAFFD